MIATAQYQHPTTGRQAQIVIFPSLEGHVVCAYVENDTNVSPLWQERRLTEANAKIWGNLYHLKLKHDYGMVRVQAAKLAQQTSRAA